MGSLLLLITTLGGSLMLWTAAPVKILFADAPKGIFGSKLSKTDKEGAPINALIMQGIIVSVLLVIFSLGQLSSGINSFLEAIRNIDGGAAGIPVLFMIIAYFKMRLQTHNTDYDHDYYFLGKKPIWALICASPMLVMFVVANITALIPSPEAWQNELAQSLIHLFVGLGGIVAAWLYCEYGWRKWRKNNPDDHSLFNEIGTQEEMHFKNIIKDKESQENKNDTLPELKQELNDT